MCYTPMCFNGGAYCQSTISPRIPTQPVISCLINRPWVSDIFYSNFPAGHGRYIYRERERE